MNSNAPPSRITGKPTQKLFSGRVLGQHEVQYYRCIDTGYIQTEDPFWLDEAYSSVMTKLDLGLINRNIESSAFVADLIERCFPKFAFGLDFGGGYGMFVRRMRDLGFDFLRSDPHCQNLFAEHYDRSDFPSRNFDVVTAFEVFEHISNPREIVAELLSIAPTIVFSTELQPTTSIQSTDDWWYFIPETGQHISFFTKKSLEMLASIFDARLYTDGRSLHIISRVEPESDPFPVPPPLSYLDRAFGKLRRMVNRHQIAVVPNKRTSLLKSDFEQARARLIIEMNERISE